MIYNLHTHSKFSSGDALPKVSEIVARAHELGQPAIGLTDHGNIAGSVQLYREATKRGLKPFPGSELYVVKDRYELMAADRGSKPKRHHMCVVAYTTQGYRNLVKLSTLSGRNFYNKPIVGFHDFAELSEAGLLEGIAATSGCYYGYIAQAISIEDYKQARNIMALMSKWFPRFYVEMQNHDIDHGNGSTDDTLAQNLFEISEAMGIPVILTQDSHYVDADHRPDHESLKRLISWGDDPDDAVFPGDGFQIADEQWFLDHHNRERFLAGCAGLKDLYDAHDLSISQLDKYSYNIPFTVADPDKELRARTTERLGSLSAKYRARLEDELSIVSDTGMAGYLLLVASVTDWCNDNDVFYAARGSASGSIICWLLGITQVDPLKYDLDFSRFISRDRTKPPDVDLDVEKHRRNDLIKMLGDNYAILQIGTWLEMSISGDEEDGAGSIFVRFKSKWNKRHENKINDWSQVPADERSQLRSLAEHSPYFAYGTHAAGVIVATTNEEIESLVPSMRVKKGSEVHYVSQFPMNDIEALGLVKLDVLGSATLEILNRCMRNLDRSIKDGLDWIPTSDTSTYRMIARGSTDGVFQLEGWSARMGVRELKPTKLDDIIASMALFRPAAMSSGATDSYIQRKQRTEAIPDHPDVVRKHTLRTYGTVIYQDQVISILRDMGMDADNLTAFLKAVKASNANVGDAGKVIEGFREMIQGMAEPHGIVGDLWDWFWETISGFASYAFNLAHSTVYGLTAYRCAYLVNHYPTEFFAAALTTWSGTKKEEQYVKAARERGIKFRRPSLNRSDLSYTPLREGTILRGLRAVDGIGKRTAEQIIAARPAGGFESVDHFTELVGTGISGVKAYKTTGDMDSGIFGKMNKAGMFNAL